MKRILNIFSTLVLCVSLHMQAAPLAKHQLTITVSPAGSGTVNITSISLQEGAARSISATPESGFEFAGWYVGERLESENNPVRFTMGQQDVTLSARFRFNPDSPDDPSANFYNPSTGELIIDRFDKETLDEAVSAQLNGVSYNDVKSVVIAGEMSESDYSVVSWFTSAEKIDLSRVSGHTAMPAWVFEQMEMSSLLLPASLETIGNGAFSGCSKLEQITLYALAPPVFSGSVDDTFEDVPVDVVLRVPAASMPLYSAAAGWNSFTILPISQQSLTVNLPADKMSLYENMFLELLDTKSGQQRRYVLTDKSSYTFDGVLNGTAYRLTLVNGKNRVFGQEMITFYGNDTTMGFSSLLTPMDLRLLVLDDKGEDVSVHTQIGWTDIDGKALGKGSLLKGIAEQDVLNYSVSLDEVLGIAFVEPKQTVSVVADASEPVVTCTLQPLSRATISGVVLDSLTQQPLRNANITIITTLNGKYRTTLQTTTDKDGIFSIETADAPMNMIVSASGYATLNLDVTESDLRLLLAPQSGRVIDIAYRYFPISKQGSIFQPQTGYADYRNVAFSIFNHTKKKRISVENEFTCLRLTDIVGVGDSLVVTLHSTNNIFADVTCGLRVSDRMSLGFDLYENGAITSLLTEYANDAVALLFDKNGNMVMQKPYVNNTVSFTRLPEGDYTLVSMERNNRYNTIGSIRGLSDAGLQVNEDYVLSELSVVAGRINEVQIQSVPSLLNKIEWLVASNTSLTANKASITSGSYLTLRSKLAFNAQYKSEISNVCLLMDMPDNVVFVENSVMADAGISDYTITGNLLEVPLHNLDALVRFCVIPTASGNYYQSAFVRFTYNGKEIMQPVGQAAYTAEDATINVNVNYKDKQFVVSGQTQANSDIIIYDNGVQIGHTSSNASGKWTANCNINNDYNLSSHNLYASIAVPNGLQLQTQTKKVVYDVTNVTLNTVKMSFYNGWLHKNVSVTWNCQTGKADNTSYMFYTGTKFLFSVEFSNNSPEIINSAKLNVELDSRATIQLPLAYNEKTDRWEAKHYFDTESGLPINLSVEGFVQHNMKIDSELIHDIVANQWITSGAFNDITALINEALQNGNDELAEHLIDSIAGQVADSTPMSEEEIEELIRTNDDIVNELDITPLTQEELTLREYFTALSSLVSRNTCEGLVESEMTSNGYRAISKTNGSNIYVYTSVERWEVVDFDECVRYSVDLTQTDITGIHIDDIPSTNDINEVMAWFEQAGSLLMQLQERVQELEKKTNEYKAALDKQGRTIKLRQLLIHRALKQSKGNRERWKELANSYVKNEIKIKSVIKGIGDIATIIKDSNNNINGLSVQDLMDMYKKGLSDGAKIKEAYEEAEKNIADEKEKKETQQQIVEEGLQKGLDNFAQLSALTTNIIIEQVVLDSLINIPLDSLINTPLDSLLNTPLDSLINEQDEEIPYFYLQPIVTLSYVKTVSSIICVYVVIDDIDDESGDDDNIGDNIDDSNDNGLHLHFSLNPYVPPIHDPSGYVYEAVGDNRVEGVQATIYYKRTYENMFGEQVEEETLWNASDYGQENPLFTDEQGMYHWDVPQGLWQVRFEKDGYEPTQSEWLPVPPPQLDVNIPIVQLRQPEVIHAAAFANAVNISFDKYMLADDLTQDNIFVTAGGQIVSGTLQYLDIKDSQTTLTREVRFVPDEEFGSTQITLTVSNRVRSYAEVQMAQTFQQTFDVEGLGELPVAATPEPSIPAGSTVQAYTELYLTSATEGAIIRYTIDGTEPDCNTGLVYTGQPILLSDNINTIRAIACAEDHQTSQVVEFAYTIGNGNTTDIDNTQLQMKVYTVGNTLCIDNATSTCYVYSVDGQLLYAGAGGRIALLAGVYVVRCGNHIDKVCICAQ